MAREALVLILFLVFVAALVVGIAVLVGQVARIGQRELKAERDALRTLVDNVESLAINHLEGNPFAIIVLDEIRSAQRSLRQKGLK